MRSDVLRMFDSEWKRKGRGEEGRLLAGMKESLWDLSVTSSLKSEKVRSIIRSEILWYSFGVCMKLRIFISRSNKKEISMDVWMFHDIRDGNVVQQYVVSVTIMTCEKSSHNISRRYSDRSWRNIFQDLTLTANSMSDDEVRNYIRHSNNRMHVDIKLHAYTETVKFDET